jgi:hypothetical protein
MNFSIPAAGMQAASAALESAANGLNHVFQNASNPLTSGSTMGDSVDLSTAMLGMLKSNLDFTANVKTAVVENSMAQSTFSILG